MNWLRFVLLIGIVLVVISCLMMGVLCVGVYV